MEGLKARLSLLEALVSTLTGGDAVGPQVTGVRAKPESGLQEALNRAVAEKNLLLGEKERLERELGGLQRRVEEMRRETEKLRNKPCPPQSPMVPPRPSPSLQNGDLTRPAGGKRSTQSTTHSQSYHKNVPCTKSYFYLQIFCCTGCTFT